MKSLKNTQRFSRASILLHTLFLQFTEADKHSNPTHCYFTFKVQLIVFHPDSSKTIYIPPSATRLNCPQKYSFTRLSHIYLLCSTAKMRFRNSWNHLEIKPQTHAKVTAHPARPKAARQFLSLHCVPTHFHHCSASLTTHSGGKPNSLKKRQVRNHTLLTPWVNQPCDEQCKQLSSVPQGRILHACTHSQAALNQSTQSSENMSEIYLLGNSKFLHFSQQRAIFHTPCRGPFP